MQDYVDSIFIKIASFPPGGLRLTMVWNVSWLFSIFFPLFDNDHPYDSLSFFFQFEMNKK